MNPHSFKVTVGIGLGFMVRVAARVRYEVGIRVMYAE